MADGITNYAHAISDEKYELILKAPPGISNYKPNRAQMATNSDPAAHVCL